MWSYKKQKALTNRLLSTRSKLQSSSYQYKYLMGYLRGTKSAPISVSTKSSYQQQINALRRRVARNTPANVYFKKEEALSKSNDNTIKIINVNVSSNVIADPDFRLNITGDQWANRWIRFKYNSGAIDIKSVRMVVYVPKIADAIFVPPETNTGMVQVPDPAAFTVLYDRYLQNVQSLQHNCHTVFVNLRNRLTTYNTHNTLLEKNPIKVTFIIETGTASLASAGYLGYIYCARDK